MKYILCKKNLTIERFNIFKNLLIKYYYVYFLLFFILGFLSNEFIYKKYFQKEKEKIIIIDENRTEFSIKNAYVYMISLKIKFPEVALAQIICESNEGTSDIAKIGYNLFGMKDAKNRPTTSIGVYKNHAQYMNWQKSIEDYALWQATNLKKINQCNTNEQYIKLLEELNYATDINYSQKIKKILNNIDKYIK